MREERLDQPHPFPTDIAADNALEQRLIRRKHPLLQTLR